MSAPASTLPPQPSSPPFWQMLNWIFRPIAFQDECRSKLGDTFSVNFPTFERPMVLLTRPEHIAALFKERRHGLPPGRSISLEPILGSRSVLLLEGSEHLARRKLMLPPFHGERMRAYEEQITEIVEREIDSWPIGETFPIHPRMQAVTLEAILNAVFGVSDEARRARLRPLLGELLDQTAGGSLQIKFMLSRWIPWIDSPLVELRRSLAEADRLLLAEAAERRADPDLADRTDILSLLVQARFEDGEPMSDSELRDQLMTLLVAGHETTATALAWAFDLLLRNPGPYERLRAEVRAGESDEYLRATIAEVLRLRPVVPLAGRRLAAPLVADGLELPAGTDVTPAIWLTHTNPDVYPDPLAFKPERFLSQPPETYSWIPFGGGIRRCLGATFAEFEMRIALRSILARCELVSATGKPEGVRRRNVTLSPKHGTPVRLLSRAARQPTPEPVAA